MELNSRRIVGWAMADHRRTELAMDALRMAIAAQRPAAGLIHHSDRGVQYALPPHQPLDPAAAFSAALRLQFDMDARAAMAAVSVWQALR